MVRRKVYVDCGGLDARFFAHNEEIDLCWRMRLFGHRIACVTQSAVYHLGGGTLPQGNPRKTFLNFRNNLLMLYKNLPADRLAHVMRWRWLLDHVAALQLLLTGKMDDAKAIMRARREFNSWKKEYASVREDIQMRATSVSGQSKDSPAMLAEISILWNYYILRRKIFARCWGRKVKG